MFHIFHADHAVVESHVVDKLLPGDMFYVINDMSSLLFVYLGHSQSNIMLNTTYFVISKTNDSMNNLVLWLHNSMSDKISQKRILIQ